MKANCYMNQINMFSLSRMALVLAVMFVFTLSAGASSYARNAASGNWSTPADWNPTTPLNGPQGTDTVIFASADESGSPFTVNNTVDSGFAGIIAALNYTDFQPSTGPYVLSGHIHPGQQNTARHQTACWSEDKLAPVLAPPPRMLTSMVAARLK